MTYIYAFVYSLHISFDYLIARGIFIKKTILIKESDFFLAYVTRYPHIYKIVTSFSLHFFLKTIVSFLKNDRFFKNEKLSFMKKISPMNPSFMTVNLNFFKRVFYISSRILNWMFSNLGSSDQKIYFLFKGSLTIVTEGLLLRFVNERLFLKIEKRVFLKKVLENDIRLQIYK